MKDVPVSKEVLWGLFESWKDISQYYDSKNKTPKNIPLSIVKEIIFSCPSMGDDWAYLKTKRIEEAYKKGKMEAINKITGEINQLRKELGEDESEGISCNNNR